MTRSPRPRRSTRRRARRPAATCGPGRDVDPVTTPAGGALTVCCIFIASRTSTGLARRRPRRRPRRRRGRRCPASARAASRCATASAGSANRGTRAQRDVPVRRVHVDARRPVDGHVVRRARCRRPRASPRSARRRRPRRRGRRRRSRRGRRATRRRRSLVAGRDEPVRCGWETTLRQPTGMPRWTPRAQPVALGQRDAPRRTAGARSGVPARSTASDRACGRGRRCSTSPGQERLVAQDRDQQVAVGDHAVDPGLGERVGEPAGGLLAGRRPGDHLGEHRVVVRRDLVAATRSRSRAGGRAG